MTTGSGFFGEESGAAQPSPATGAGDDAEGTFADVLNGFSLGGGRGRAKRSWRGPAEDEQPAAAGASEWVDPAEVAPAPGESPSWPPADVGESSWGESHRDESYGDGQGTPARARLPKVDPEWSSPAEETGFVRPYALTGGRTKANYALELETLISTNPVESALSVPDHTEHQSIVEECQTPRSVAEIAALLRVPIGVARVLIGDVADAGLVTVHKTISGTDGAEAHFTLMERVLSGLRRL